MTNKNGVLTLAVRAGKKRIELLLSLIAEYDAARRIRDTEKREYVCDCIIQAICLVCQNPILLERGFQAHIEGKKLKDVSLNFDKDIYWFDTEPVGKI